MHQTLGILVVSIAFLFAGVPVVGADHAQDTPAGTVVFDHRGGNEWWVEARVTLAGTPTEVHARHEGASQWHKLTLRDWGNWAGSFHIPPGHDVLFRAVKGGTTETSCWFTHPQGIESCDEGEVGDFTASFRTNGGNQWWVEAWVDATQPLAGVDARVEGGAWQALEKRSWGAWAASFFVPEGSIITFQARSTSGDTVLSDRYQWPSGEKVGDSPDPPPGGDFSASFRTNGGNQWWVEVFVDANEPLAGVDAKAGEGPWRSLEKRSWGAWAASFFVPEGSIITFQARSTSGDTVQSGGYLWPSGEPVGTTPPGDPGFMATFTGIKGNQWWVETKVDTNQGLAGVAVRADTEDWTPLQKRDWGAWAASLYLPTGTHVMFRATATDGQVAYSDTYRWTNAQHMGPATEWPQEGSYVTYDLHSSGGSPAGWPRAVFDLTVHLTYQDGVWTATCTGWREDYDHEGELVDRVPIDETGSFPPAYAPTQPGSMVGQEVQIDHIVKECDNRPYRDILKVQTKTTYGVDREGTEVAAPAWHATFRPEWQQAGDGHWHDKTGLVLHWEWSGSGGGFEGTMTHTDAPIGPDDPAPLPAG